MAVRGAGRAWGLSARPSARAGNADEQEARWAGRRGGEEARRQGERGGADAEAASAPTTASRAGSSPPPAPSARTLRCRLRGRRLPPAQAPQTPIDAGPVDAGSVDASRRRSGSVRGGRRGAFELRRRRGAFGLRRRDVSRGGAVSGRSEKRSTTSAASTKSSRQPLRRGDVPRQIGERGVDADGRLGRGDVLGEQRHGGGGSVVSAATSPARDAPSTRSSSAREGSPRWGGAPSAPVASGRPRAGSTASTLRDRSGRSATSDGRSR